MSDAIFLRCLAKRDDAAAYEAYLRLKFDVFVLEQGWRLPADHHRGRCQPDAHDDTSLFAVAQTTPHSALGIVRATPAIGDFPHRALFSTHLEADPVRALEGAIFTVNSFAVARHIRGHRLPCPFSSGPLTIAVQLMCLLVGALRERGAALILLSAMPNASARLCAKLGFRVIDPIVPFKPPAHALLNMALVINDQEHFRAIRSPLQCDPTPLAPAEVRCREYFRSREKAVCQEASVATLITSAAMVGSAA